MPAECGDNNNIPGIKMVQRKMTGRSHVYKLYFHPQYTPKTSCNVSKTKDRHENV